MAKGRKITSDSSKKPIEQYEHKDKERLNNPPVGLVNEKTDTDYGQKKKTYEYDPHLDPQLQWAGKTEHTSFDVPIVSLHVHERIDPKTIIDSVKKVNGTLVTLWHNESLSSIYPWIGWQSIYEEMIQYIMEK